MDKKNIIVIGIATLLIIVGALLWKPQEKTVDVQNAPTNSVVEQIQEPTSTDVLDTDAVDVGDVDKELEGIDAQLNNL